jgi:2-haloalkanoic acid dehalogenase type II
MSLTEFKTLTFGCYGTLVDRDTGIYTALRPLLQAGHITLDRETVLAAFTKHESTQVADSTPAPYALVLTEAHRRLAKEWGILVSDDTHALFGKSVPHWPVYADAPAALQYLKRYFKLVILTNVDLESFAGTARRLETRFDAVFTAQEIGSYKPDTRIFDRMVAALANLGVARREVLHVSGSVDRDLVPANRGGLACAWIDRRRVGTAEAPARTAPCQFRFASMVDIVKAHREQLLA